MLRGYTRVVITNTDAYRRESELHRWEKLRRMSAEESIAVGEALLTSEILRLAASPGRPPTPSCSCRMPRPKR